MNSKKKKKRTAKTVRKFNRSMTHEDEKELAALREQEEAALAMEAADTYLHRSRST